MNPNIDDYGHEQRFKPGSSGNPLGRPRKWVSQLRDQGYRLSEVNDALQVILSMNYKELGEVWNDPASTALEKAVAKAIQTDMKKGKLDSIELLLTRVFGRPKQDVELRATVATTGYKLPDGSDLEI